MVGIMIDQGIVCLVDITGVVLFGVRIVCLGAVVPFS